MTHRLNNCDRDSPAITARRDYGAFVRWIGCAMLALSALLLSACGGGGSNATHPSLATARNSPGPSSSGSPFPKTAALHAARSALLAVSDLPAGWSTSAASHSNDETAFDARLASCLHVSPTLVGSAGADGAHADSPDFNSPDDTNATVSETVSIDTAPRVNSGFAVLRSPRLPGCFDSLVGPYLKQELAKDPSTASASLGQVSTGQLSFPQLGEDSVAFRSTIPFSIQGQTASVYIDVVFARSRNAVMQLSFEDVLSPFDTVTAEHIARRAYRKLTTTAIPTA